jgi:GT2 family glycosyltransferase
MTESDFWRHSYLGRSLVAMPDALRPAELAIRFANTGPDAIGLSVIYNKAIETAAPNTTLLFVHDDVYIHDPFVGARLAEALLGNDVVGLAGSWQPDPLQPSWGLCFEGEDLKPLGWQNHPELVLSGAVSHSSEGASDRAPTAQLGAYGPLSHRCHLLDGLFLAARAGALKASAVSFDERFTFDLYDLDFCRQAVRAGLTLTTWPILVTHRSGGNFASPDWRAAARLYLEKWNAIARSDELFGRTRHQAPAEA